jgi:hypothetical protein
MTDDEFREITSRIVGVFERLLPRIEAIEQAVTRLEARLEPQGDTTDASSRPSRTLSLAGCRTRAEAVSRMRAWVKYITEVQQQRSETNLIESVQGGHMDLDAATDLNDFIHEGNAKVIQDTLSAFRRVVDREFGLESWKEGID